MGMSPGFSGRSPAQDSRPHPATPGCRVRQAVASLAPLHSRLTARLLWRHGTARCRSPCDDGGFTMQYMKTRAVLNVEESDRLSFLPYMFGNDFMIAELQVYA